MGVADASAFPKLGTCFFIPASDTSVLTKWHYDESITKSKSALGISPLGCRSVWIAIGELDLPISFSGFPVDTKNFTETSEKIDGIVFDSRDAA